jgi:hypothetical protein
MASTPSFLASTPVSNPDTIVAADTTTKKDVTETFGASGGKCTSIMCTSDDTSTVLMEVYYYDAGDATAYLLGAVNVATLSGTDGTTAAVNLLDTTAIPGLDANGHLLVNAGDKVQVAANATVTAAKTVTVVGQAQDF